MKQAAIGQILALPAAAAQDPHPQEAAHEVRNRILALRTRMSRDFLELEALLAMVEQHRLWEGYAQSFREYCEDPEIGIPYGTARKLVRIYHMAEQLGVLGSPEVLEAGVDRAYVVLKASTDAGDALERLREASLLPVSEVRLMYRGDDPQERAIESVLRRIDSMNSTSRVTALVLTYWRLTYEERLEFHARIRRTADGESGPA